MFRPLVVFYLLATAVSWSFWLPLMIYNGHHVEQSSLKYLNLLGELGPAISAIICCRYFGGRPALAITLIRSLITVWAVGVLGISRAQLRDIQTTLSLQKPSYGG